MDKKNKIKHTISRRDFVQNSVKGAIGAGSGTYYTSIMLRW